MFGENLTAQAKALMMLTVKFRVQIKQRGKSSRSVLYVAYFCVNAHKHKQIPKCRQNVILKCEVT